MTPDPAPRRRKRLLDMDLILDTALDLIDKSGRLTMANLAARLGVNPSSLYHHVSDRAEIVTLIRDRLTEPLGAPLPSEGDWADRISTWVRALRNKLASHPLLV